MTRRRRVAAALAAAGLALYGILGGLGYAVQARAHEQAVRVNGFWTAVAGESTPEGLGPAEDLARALARDLDEIDAPGDFIAPPVVYRGVTDELGFAPFDATGLGCTECGPLTPEMAADVADVADGRLDAVLVDTAPPTFSTTGLPVAVEATATAVIPVAIAAAVTTARDRRREDADEARLRDMGLWEVLQGLRREVEGLRALPEDQADHERVRDRIALLESMADDILAAAHTATARAEAAGIDAAVDHHVASTDPAIQAANDALLARRQALRELG